LDFACRLALVLALASCLAATPAAALVCGESIESTISVLGEIDTYTFQASAGDVMSVSVGGPDRFSAFGVAAELRSPTNKIVNFRRILNQTLNSPLCNAHLSCETKLPLAETGTYTLRVYDFGANATGTYSLTLDAVGGSWNGGSNAPPSPVCGAVTDGTRTIACGETVTGQLDVHADSDTYTFFAAAGDVVGVTVARPAGGTVNPVSALFAPGDGALVHFGGANFCEHSSCESEPLPATGVYTLVVVDSGLTHTGPYSITLESVRESFDGASNGPPTPVCSAPADGTRSIACGQRVTGDISAPGDSDTFTFRADAGEGVALVVEKPPGSALDPAAELFAPDGTKLMHLSGPPYPAPPLASGPLPASGIYTIKVTDFNEGAILDSTGPYALTLVSGRLDGSACHAAPLLRCGESVGDTIAAAETETRSFAARAGDSVRIHAAGSSLDMLELVAPNGDYVSQTDPLTQSGVHTIVLGASAAGSYRLTLEAVSGSMNGGGNGWPPLVCGANIPDGSLEIACGQTRAGSLDPAGDSDTYTFLAEAGDVVTLTLSASVSGFDPVAELFGPGGTTLIGSCGPNETCVSAAVPTAGTYTVRVTPPDPASTGAYSLQMNRSPCASDCQDGIDNDADGLVDFPTDLGCANAGDLSERRECNDGFDNDGDGLLDFAGGDVGCTTNNSTLEDPQCDDGRDNDGDGAIDWDGEGAGAADSYCAGASAGSTEAPPAPSPGCGIGPGLALLLPLLAALRRPAQRRG
jgi:hypothetical protein